jgi:hypothetical protein
MKVVVVVFPGLMDLCGPRFQSSPSVDRVIKKGRVAAGFRPYRWEGIVCRDGSLLEVVPL